MKRAPPFGFEVVVDYKRIFRSWHIGAVKTVLISGERADSVAHGSVLLGVAEFHVLAVHLPDQSTDPVGDDERVAPVHAVVLADDGGLSAASAPCAVQTTARQTMWRHR